MMATYKVISGYKGMIEDVVVHTEYRGKGIGKKLMLKLLEEAKKLELTDVLLFLVTTELQQFRYIKV